MKRAGQFALALVLCAGLLTEPARGYVLNRTVSSSGGCPVLNRFVISPGSIDRRWSTSLPTSIATVGTGAARETEVEQAVLASFSVWTSVPGTTLTPGALGALQRTGTQNACNSNDQINTICFNQSDSQAFTSGVLAFARVLTSIAPGNAGQILDSDIYFRPPDSQNFRFATRQALPLNTTAFDLESLLIHELGHFFGFSHSSVWRAMMWPFAPPRGRFLGDEPQPGVRSNQLADDDRTGLRVLYPDPADLVNVGTIRGRVLPANPLALASRPPAPNETGIFGAHVVALDADTGQTVAGTFGGWSCDAGSLPVRFDGSYVLERLPVGRSYRLVVEPLDSPTGFDSISIAVMDLCRSGTNNNCLAPSSLNTSFTTRVKP